MPVKKYRVKLTTMAEIEIGVLSRQCLNRRIPDQDALRSEISAWQKRRNKKSIGVNWRFTMVDVRIKLELFSPSNQS